MNTKLKLSLLALLLGSLGASAFAQSARPVPPQVPAQAAVKSGMTWGIYPAHGVTGTATVACQGLPMPAGHPNGCDAYQGDTPGHVALPVLCMLPSHLPNPAPNTVDPQYWSGNVIATTPAVSPQAMNFQHKAQVDAYCVSQFGPNWVVADFHAGSGWKFAAYGNVSYPGKARFWVNIKDQPNGNYWAQ